MQPIGDSWNSASIATDPEIIKNPSHYQGRGGLEVFDVIEAFVPDDAHRSHAVKYLLRAGNKGSYIEDMRKCIAWCERAIEFKAGTEW